MPEEDYAGKAHAVRTNWKTISPNHDPAPGTQAVFDVLASSSQHDDPAAQAPPDGHHARVVSVGKKHQTLYFTRELTEDEKNDVDALFRTLQNALTL